MSPADLFLKCVPIRWIFYKFFSNNFEKRNHKVWYLGRIRNVKSVTQDLSNLDTPQLWNYAN